MRSRTPRRSGARGSTAPSRSGSGRSSRRSRRRARQRRADVSVFRDFPNAPLTGTWYHVALANKLAGVDLSPADDDINANFSTNFNFYLGLDNNHGAQNDLVAVLLHEFAHGLGFSQTASLTTGALLAGASRTTTTASCSTRRWACTGRS